VKADAAPVGEKVLLSLHGGGMYAFEIMQNRLKKANSQPVEILSFYHPCFIC
jgi:hypothetical protein